MQNIIAWSLIPLVLLVFVYGGTWKDETGRKFAFGRMTFWFTNVHASSVFHWRFWVPKIHRVVKGDVTRIFWGPMVFKLNPKESL